MRIEVDYSEPGTTRNVLNWVSAGVALHVALRALIFCKDGTVVTLSFDFCIFALLMAACWTTEETRALVGVPLPIMGSGLARSRSSSMRITAANVDAD